MCVPRSRMRAVRRGGGGRPDADGRPSARPSPRRRAALGSLAPRTAGESELAARPACILERCLLAGLAGVPGSAVQGQPAANLEVLLSAKLAIIVVTRGW